MICPQVVLESENAGTFGEFKKYFDEISVELKSHIKEVCQREKVAIIPNYIELWTTTIRLLYSMGGMDALEA